MQESNCESFDTHMWNTTSKGTSGLWLSNMFATYKVSLSQSRGWSKLDVRDVLLDLSLEIITMEPEPLGKLLVDTNNDIPIGWGLVVAESATSVKNTIPALDCRMHGDAKESVFHVAEGATNVIIHEVDL